MSADMNVVGGIVTLIKSEREALGQLTPGVEALTLIPAAHEAREATLAIQERIDLLQAASDTGHLHITVVREL